MRRSSAPSKIGVKFSSPTINVTSESLKSIEKSGKTAPVENAARSTQSILGLIAKVKQTSDVVCEDLSSSPTQQTTSSVTFPQSADVLIECDQNQTPHKESEGTKRIFSVVYGKPSKKKHKTWEGDGLLEVGEKSLTLKDCEGNVLGRGSGKKNSELEEGSRLFVGGKEVEIIDAVTSNAPVVSSKRPLQPTSPLPPVAKKTKRSGSLLPLGSGGLRKSPASVSLSYAPLVMPEPDLDHQWKFNPSGAPVKSVIVDPRLAKVLRPHQREGVAFLYRCVVGLRDHQYLGAILADEMGLGKTLQCITLIWTMLRQGLYGNGNLVRRVLVVTPSSLTRNWHQEFLRWLGKDRIHIFVVDQKNKAKDFQHFPNMPVMIISYEMLVRNYDDVAAVPFDLIICDEGHRLKNNSIRASMLLSQLPCQRRILLSGTPVQNDLQEFYALVNFVNPNILGTYPEFRKNFEEAIVMSRQPHSSAEVKALGQVKAQELSCCTAGFVLRRTQEVLDTYLPSKHEAVVFCKPSQIQLELFEAAIKCWEGGGGESSEGQRGASHLAVITALKKISNHPVLLKERDSDKESDYLYEYLNEELSRLSGDMAMIEDASKLSVVKSLLHSAVQARERVVLVSYFTQTLDLLTALCDQYGYSHCRLDGNTASTRRVDIVNEFNSIHSTYSVFLLSARAGGVGLNLTGASRLVLFDSDWNPANDLQAMARVWRDGQRRRVLIYRLLTTGSIEEKIFQRQLSKAGLNEAVVDPSHTSAVRLSDEELKDLFSVGYETDSLTHSALPCDCRGEGDVPCPVVPQSDDRQCQLMTSSSTAQTLRMNQLFQWEHYRQPIPADLLQTMGLEGAGEFISFVFRNVLENTPPNTSVNL